MCDQGQVGAGGGADSVVISVSNVMTRVGASELSRLDLPNPRSWNRISIARSFGVNRWSEVGETCPRGGGGIRMGISHTRKVICQVWSLAQTGFGKAAWLS